MQSFRVRLPQTSSPILAVMAMLAVASPASAAHKDYQGWFVALDLATTQPNSLDQHFANHIDSSLSPVTQERLVMDNDSDSTYRVSVGHSFGKSLGTLKVSYWSFDNDDEMTQTLNGYVFPTVFGGGYYNSGYAYYGPPYGGMYLYNSSGVNVVATSKVKASTIDLDYVRPIATGDKVSLSWLAGLRVASYEEEQNFAGFDGSYNYLQSKQLESEAAGLRIGAAAEFEFGDHFSLVSSAVFSFLQAETDGMASQFFENGGRLETRQATNDHIRGEIRDFDLKAVWSYGALDYFLGYSMSSWGGLVADPLSGGTMLATGPIGDRSRDGISFNSLHGGVKWRFGKSK